MIRLFYTERHKDSELALDFLKTKKVQFEACDVEKLGIIHALESDIGTVEIPTIVSCDGTFAGLENIKSYLGTE
jgi:hypothetical protein